MNVFITGGAGFIGCNAAKRFLDRGDEVWILDNFSRHEGLSANVDWLNEQGGQVECVEGDVRDFDLLSSLLLQNEFDVVLHLAAQTAVTISVADPRLDFEVNALGTFNLVEAIRASGTDPIVLYSSTNKVYGGMEDVRIVERDGRYAYADLPNGVPETRALDFHSPYGCSKGAADQYVIDYSRIYGLRTVSFRQSCIYGNRQFGMEDQGWVAWFTIAAVLGRPVVIYGDGKQVRDVLHIDDLVNLYELAVANPRACVGQAFNVGGGPENAISLLDLVAMLEELGGRPLPHTFDEWRPGDQRVFICDVSKAEQALGWTPRVSPRDGVAQLYEWVVENRSLFTRAAAPAGAGRASR